MKLNRQVRSWDFFILRVTRNHVSSHSKQSFQLILISTPSYSRGKEAPTTGNDGVIPTTLFLLSGCPCKNTTMHQVLSSAIKRFCAIIQMKKMNFNFPCSKLLKSIKLKQGQNSICKQVEWSKFYLLIVTNNHEIKYLKQQNVLLKQGIKKGHKAWYYFNDMRTT